MKTIKCQNCGQQHKQTLSNCCWIDCDCGSKICGQCGSLNIQSMNIEEYCEDDEYWCCLECGDCGLQGCALCI